MKFNTYSFFVVALLSVFFSICNHSYAKNHVDSRYHMTADHIYSIDNHSIIATGNVVLQFKSTTVTAERVEYDVKTKNIKASGNVTAEDRNQKIQASEVHYNLNKNIITMYEVSGSLQNKYFFCASSLSEEEDGTYVFNNVSLTTCSGTNPDWSFNFYKAKAKMDGYIVGDHATANIAKVPVIYVPKFIYPLKVSRQTGFLIPSAGYSNKQGTWLSQEFFWAIDYDKDITFKATTFSERGVLGGAEYRHALSSNSNIYLEANGIKDLDSPVSEEQRWKYTTKTSILLFDNFHILADGESVSDYMYTRDYIDFSLYKPENKNTENTYYQQYHVRYFSKYSNITLKYRDDTKYNDLSTGFKKSFTILKPELTIEKYGLNLNGIKLDYYQSWSTVKHGVFTKQFQKNNNYNEINYNRFHTNAKIYKTAIFDIFSITPYIKAYYTNWYNLSYDPLLKKHSKNNFSYVVRKNSSSYERLLPEIGYKMDINEIYALHFGGKHGIINSFEYTYLEKVDQEGLPDYIKEDRLEGSNLLTWTLTNYFKKGAWNFDLTAKQGFNFLKEDSILVPLELKSNFSKQGLFSNDIETKLDYYSYRNKKSKEPITSLTNNFKIHPSNSFYFKVEYAYEKKTGDDFNTSIEASIGNTYRNLELYVSNIWKSSKSHLSVAGLESVGSKFSFVYNSQCWSFATAFSTEKFRDISKRKEERDYKVEFGISLKELGSTNLKVYSQNKKYN